MVIPSANSRELHDSSNVDPFGKTNKSSSNSTAHPLFGTSRTFGPPMAASGFAEKIPSPFGSTSSHFAGSTFSIQNQGNALQQSDFHFGPSTVSAPPYETSFASVSGLAFGTPTAALISDSSTKKTFGSTSTVFGVPPSFGSGGSVGDSSVNWAPGNPASGASTMTIFGTTNNSGIGFKSIPKVLLSNSAHSSTSSMFGLSNEPPFAPGSSSSGVSTSIFGFPSTSTFQFTTTPGFGIKSTPLFWSASASSLSGPKSNPPIGAPSTSHFPDLTTTRFHLSSTSAPGKSSIFGIPSCSESIGATKLGSNVRNQCQGSGVAPYSATPEVLRANSRYSVGRIKSISAMQIYKDKSHEELRLEDYVLRKKDGQKRGVGQSLGSACFKTFDTSANIFCCPPLPNHSSVNHPFHPFKSNFSVSKSQAFVMPSKTISMASTLSPSVIPLFSTNLYPSQSQANIPQPNIFSSMPTFTRDLNPSSITPLSELVPTNSFKSPTISSTFTSASASAFSSIEPLFLVSPSMQSTSVTALGPGTSILHASQPGKLAEKVDSLSKNYLNQPSQGLTMLTEVGSQNITGQQQCAFSSTMSMESSLVVNPFATPSAVDRPSAATSIQCGISSLPVSNKLSSDRRTSLLRIRHVSFRHNSLLSAQRHKCRSNEPKVPFFSDKKDTCGRIAPLLPRENPRAWVMNSLSGQEHTPLHSYADGRICEDKACPNSSFQLNINPTVVSDDASIQDEDLSAMTNSHQDAAAVAEKHEAYISSLMPKLPDREYYTEPPLKELKAKERAEPGYCSHVNDFVVGRQGYGSIKFLGETVRKRPRLDKASISPLRLRYSISNAFVKGQGSSTLMALEFTDSKRC